MSEARITSGEDARAFLLAGNAYLTLRSRVTGTRYTYRVRESRSGEVYFVSSLYGTDNTSDYAYLGVIDDGGFRVTAKSQFTVDSPQAKAFAWSYARIITQDELPDNLELWHEGRCGRCGRLLTVPESIAKGIGPTCERIP